MNNSSSSSSSSSFYSYDVFISFRGPDTRKRFIGYLYPKLCEIKEAKIFMDEPKIEPGDLIRETLIKAIQGSRIGLVIFSSDYASSTHCLDELAYIIERSIDQNRMFFVPVFYDVQPSILDKKYGSFEEALTKHEIESKVGKHKIDQWRAALKKAAGVAGFTSNNYRFDSVLIDDIATCITKKLSKLREGDKKNTKTDQFTDEQSKSLELSQLFQLIKDYEDINGVPPSTLVGSTAAPTSEKNNRWLKRIAKYGLNLVAQGTSSALFGIEIEGDDKVFHSSV